MNVVRNEGSRRLLCVRMGIVGLVGCLLLEVSWPEHVFAQEEFATVRVQDEIEEIDSEFQAVQFDIPSVVVEATGERFYGMQDVVEMLDGVGQMVWQTLERRELPALRNYAAWYLAEATAALEAAEAPECSQLCVTSASVEAAYRIVETGNQAILSLEDLLFDLEIESDPVEARVELLYESNQQLARWAHTNNVIPGVDRGRYLIVVTKPNFQEVRDKRNLMDEVRNRLVCRLEPEGSDSHSLCKLQQD